jgi:TolB protein
VKFVAIAASTAVWALAASAMPPAWLPDAREPGACALQRVTNAAPGELHFQFEGVSHDGRHLFVAWESGARKGAYVLDIASGERRELANLDNAGVFSPDDTRILSARSLPDRTTELVEYSLDSGAMTPVAPHPRHEFLATYSRDGRWILFNSYRTGRSDIYRVPRDGGDPERLTAYDGYEAHAALSPAMEEILFHRDLGEGDYDIFRLDLARRTVTPFAGGAGEQAYPSWSPDGRFVAFASDHGASAGKLDIYVATAKGEIVSRVTKNPGYNAYPSWSRDGRWLYFNAERAAGTRDVLRAAIDDAGHCRPAT